MSVRALYESAQLAPYRLAAAIPTPTFTAPPGADNFTQILNWVFWGAVYLSVAAFIICGVGLLFGDKHEELGKHGKAFGRTMAGAVVIGTASLFAAAATGQ
jgi:uncharacterized membrane protein YjfL (UPF0719 family)